MNTQYACYLCDPFGVRLSDASTMLELAYSRVVNEVSTLTLTLPGTFDTRMIRIPDGRIELWRNVGGGLYLETGTTWLIKRMRQTIDRAGLKTLKIEADTPLCLLREPGRFVNYAAASAQALYAATPADDGIKQIARENIGSSASGSRNISSLVSVAANLSAGSSIAKGFAWRDCLKTMQEFAQASTAAGTYVAFDIVAPTPDTLEFRTYTQQRGVDHRFPNGLNPVLLSPEMGNLGETTLTTDYRNEVTYALAGGRGEQSARLTASAQDTTRQGVSPFGYREQFVDATQYTTTTGLSSEAAGVVREGRPRTIFTGRLLDTLDTQYGVHWAWGDFVTAQAFGQLYDCRIEAVTVTVRPGADAESVDAWLRYDSGSTAT